MPELPEPSADSVPRPPRTFLAWALAATILCFLPLGLIALLYGLRVERAVSEGRPDDAGRYSRVARRWVVATVVVGALVYALLAIVFALLGAFAP